MMLALETAPSTVAELPLFDGGPYPASVRAVTPLLAYFIDKNGFYQVCRQYPEVALKVLAVVGRRLRHLVMVVESMTFGSVTQRLAKLLLDASREEGGAEFALPLTHQETHPGWAPCARSYPATWHDSKAKDSSRWKGGKYPLRTAPASNARRRHRHENRYGNPLRGGPGAARRGPDRRATVRFRLNVYKEIRRMLPDWLRAQAEVKLTERARTVAAIRTPRSWKPAASSSRSGSPRSWAASPSARPSTPVPLRSSNATATASRKSFSKASRASS